MNAILYSFVFKPASLASTEMCQKSYPLTWVIISTETVAKILISETANMFVLPYSGGY